MIIITKTGRKRVSYINHSYVHSSNYFILFSILALRGSSCCGTRLCAWICQLSWHEYTNAFSVCVPRWASRAGEDLCLLFGGQNHRALGSDLRHTAVEAALFDESSCRLGAVPEPCVIAWIGDYESFAFILGLVGTVVLKVVSAVGEYPPHQQLNLQWGASSLAGPPPLSFRLVGSLGDHMYRSTTVHVQWVAQVHSAASLIHKVHGEASQVVSLEIRLKLAVPPEACPVSLSAADSSAAFVLSWLFNKVLMAFGSWFSIQHPLCSYPFIGAVVLEHNLCCPIELEFFIYTMIIPDLVTLGVPRSASCVLRPEQVVAFGLHRFARRASHFPRRCFAG